MELLQEFAILATRVVVIGQEEGHQALRKVIRQVNSTCHIYRIELPLGQEVINAWLDLLDDIWEGTFVLNQGEGWTAKLVDISWELEDRLWELDFFAGLPKERVSIAQ